MDFEVWATHRRDPLRRRRLAVGSFLGIGVVVGMIAAGFSGAGRMPIVPEEEPVEVELLPPEEEEEPEPEEEEPIVPVEPNPQAMAALPRAAPAIESPTDVPDEPAPESEPTDGDGHGGDPFARKGGTGDGRGTTIGPAPPPPPAAPPPVAKAKPKKKSPVRITEDMTPPKPIAQAAPGYPASAKAAGVEGTVVVKYVISESGRVTAASVVRGPPELAAACLAAVKTWTFEPARDASGRAVSVHRVARFPFRITT